MSIYRKNRGDSGEQLVVDYIKKQGYAILARNYRTKTGEIDIIGRKDSTIAFIEVKWRAQSDIDPTTAVNHLKQQKIMATAKHFITRYQQKEELNYRFDVGIISQNDTTEELMYIPHAFDWNE